MVAVALVARQELPVLKSIVLPIYLMHLSTYINTGTGTVCTSASYSSMYSYTMFKSRAESVRRVENRLRERQP
jgi:hypothetical protein